MGQPIHHSLQGAIEYPYTISYAIRKRLQYDSFLELPKEKQPPEDIWDDGDAVEEWFEKVFPKDKKKKQQDHIYLNINDVEG